jgi:hypothetical protein
MTSPRLCPKCEVYKKHWLAKKLPETSSQEDWLAGKPLYWRFYELSYPFSESVLRIEPLHKGRIKFSPC